MRARPNLHELLNFRCTQCSDRDARLGYFLLHINMGRRLSFSRMNSTSGGRPVVRFGSEFAWASIRATASARPLHPVNSPP